MDAYDIKVGKWYRAKRYRENFGYNNDRRVIYIGPNTVQYDSDTVRNGRHYPKTTMTAFLNWAAREVTEEEIRQYDERNFGPKKQSGESENLS